MKMKEKTSKGRQQKKTTGMKGSDLFVRQLEEEGVQMIFGLPGEENLDLLESLRTSKIRCIVTRHEQAAAFMAATYGRLTGKAGVCLSTLGPGATNLVTGIAHAQLIGSPLVSISGQKALKDNWQGKFQMVDIVNLMKPITKKSISIIDKNMIPTVVHDAFSLAEEERPGAVHIELPEDVAGEEASAHVQESHPIRRPSPDKKAIKAAAQLINDAKYPLIIASSGANKNGITKHLTSLLEKSGIYLVHTQMAKGVIPADHPQSMFGVGIHKRDYVNCGIEKADVIITLGYNIVEYPPFVWNGLLDKTIVHIDFVEAQIDKYYNPKVQVIGDISHTLRALTEEIAKRRAFPVFAKTRSLIEEKFSQPYASKVPMLPQEIVAHVRQEMGKEDIITLDNGIYKLWFARLYKTYAPNTVILDNALATMGAGLPSAIAAKILYPQKKVLAICGDGGFMMNSQELETAMRLKIPVVVLILNDNAFGFIKWKQQNMGLKDFALDYTNPDFVAYAKSYGAQGFLVQKKGDLPLMLKKAFASGKVCVIECPIDYSKNYAVFSQELENIVCRI